jgi:hypothetical protein
MFVTPVSIMTETRDMVDPKYAFKYTSIMKKNANAIQIIHVPLEIRPIRSFMHKFMYSLNGKKANSSSGSLALTDRKKNFLKML